MENDLLARFAEPIAFLWNPQERVFWLYLVSALALTAWVFRRQPGRRCRIRDFLRYCFPRRVFLSPSARLDYRFFIVNRWVFGFLFAPCFAGLGRATAAAARKALESLFPDFADRVEPGFAWVAFYTFANVLAVDLALFLAHWLQHKNRFLWEFHKIHHSATVLHPVTVYRMHPVDDLLAFALSTIASATVYAGFDWIATSPLQEITFAGVNLLTFLFYLLGYNLRHSHVWLSYGRFWSYLLISPAQHQIHHSSLPRHRDCNLGFLFAFWDLAAGTLYVPERREHFPMGLCEGESDAYRSLASLYFRPFARGLEQSRFATGLTIFLLVFLAARGLAHYRPAVSFSVFLEDLTTTEVADLLQRGYRTVVVPTAGTEQNGPHLVLGKHHRIVRYAAERIARELGNTLVAPIVDYVPEGNIDPPDGHMRFSGTLTVPEEVFEGVLEAAARSLAAHGFTTIAFLGDSGGNQSGQARVAKRLGREWQGRGIRVLQVSDYYTGNGQLEWLREHGWDVAQIGTHGGIRDTSELLYVDPTAVRRAYMAMANPPQPGVSGEYWRASASLGKVLLRLKIRAAVAQIRSLTGDRFPLTEPD
jgi:sterol desaturase/sphingolipid hydroxylase (fatty acid hydroxylase superfamily)/creatinine amidohydrolase/Fe(II)-dependent formamide hydrolase-like protein